MSTNGKNGFSNGIFLARLVALLKEEGVLGTPRNIPVVRFQHPAKLQETLALSLGPTPTDENHLLALCKDVVHYSVKTGHPHFRNQLYGGVDPYGLAGAWLTEALNTNQYTFEVGPVFTLAERAIFQRVLKMVGFSGGDGIFAAGGSMSNMYAMVLARYKLAPETKTKGISGLPPLVAFASEDSHYSVLKGAHWLGIGIDNVIKVKTDGEGSMIPQELISNIEKAKADGKLPFIVVATAGTTVLGAFDPLETLSSICKKQKMWLHVDACWGGTLMLSKKYSQPLKGLNRVDSVSWNPHKMLGAPLQCSMLLVKEKGLLHQCNSASASYLFQQDKFYDVEYDTGDKSVQCGRKVDAFKLWLMWKARGDNGLERLVDNAMDCAMYFKKVITDRPGFVLVIPEIKCTNVCFWYIPPSLRGQEETAEWWDEVHTVAPKLKELLVMTGTLMISYQPQVHKGFKNFFRFVATCHPVLTAADIDHIVHQIESHGEQL